MFTSDVQFIQVSASQCARLCVEQQGTSCHGFYYCEVKLWCHLMFAQSQTHGASVDANPNNPDILCNYYRSKYCLTNHICLKCENTIISINIIGHLEEC